MEQKYDPKEFINILDKHKRPGEKKLNVPSVVVKDSQQQIL